MIKVVFLDGDEDYIETYDYYQIVNDKYIYIKDNKNTIILPLSGIQLFSEIEDSYVEIDELFNKKLSFKNR